MFVLLVGAAVAVGVTSDGDDAEPASNDVTVQDSSVDTTPTTAAAPDPSEVATRADIAPGDLDEPQGSAAAFCPLADTYQRTLDLRVAIVGAPNAAEVERLAKETLPLMNELLAAAPAEVFEPVQSARASLVPMSRWSDSDAENPVDQESSTGALSLEDIRMRVKFAASPPDPDPVLAFLSEC